MAHAKYIIQCPTHDNEGNLLKDLATACHESLFRHSPVKIEGSRVVPGIKGNWRDDKQEGFTDLEVYAEDTPEMDSTMKQLGVHVAEVANQWGVMVFKEGAGAPVPWNMSSPNADGQGSADPAAIAEYAQPEEPEGEDPLGGALSASVRPPKPLRDTERPQVSHHFL